VALKTMVYSNAEDVEPLKAGDAAPLTAKIKGSDSETITLKDALKGKKTLVVFYRGGWCPYCNAHLAALAGVQPQLTASGVQLLALSPDSPETLAKHAEERPLPYRLLSDNAHEAMKAFGIAFRMDDFTLERYKGYGIDLSAASGNEDKVLPVPAVFVIDENGTISYAHANADYTVRMKGEELLKAAGVTTPSPE
jgi:peroxiredoxin